MPALPPPPPPTPGRQRAAPPPVPVPKATRDQMALAKSAMRLRSEQLRAKVIYVDPSVETNAELDAITAQVVGELKALQDAARQSVVPDDPQQVEIELIRTLREELEKMVSARREAFIRHKIESIQRRVVNLYLTSEMQLDNSQVDHRTYEHPDDALLAAYRRHHEAIVADLRSMKYSNPSVGSEALARLQQFHKRLAAEVFARSKPELERLLGVYRDVLLVFLLRDFHASLGEFAWEVIRESRIAHGQQLDYKIKEAQFARFREVFEAKFMERLLASIQKPLADRMGGGDWRPETVRFAADARIYAEICAVMCNAVYDYLHSEGFLDLPVDWQHRVAGE